MRKRKKSIAMKPFKTISDVYFIDEFRMVSYRIFKEYSTYIQDSSTKYGINSEFLFGIIVVEQINRGSLLIRIFEKVAAVCCYFFKLDPSLGLSQIRLSTAKLVIQYPVKNLAWKLTQPSFNIECLCMLIRDRGYIDLRSKRDIQNFISWYTTGKEGNEKIPSLKVYYELFEWSLKMNYFQKLRREVEGK